MSNELRNKDGLTEAEFLARYDVSHYDRPSVTVDTVMLYISGTPAVPQLKVLLIQRGDHPSIGKWAVPGGFVQMDETVEVAAERETFEETGIHPQWLEPFDVFSEPRRDPRTRVITVAFFALFNTIPTPRAGDDAVNARWYSLNHDIMERTAESLTVRFNLQEGETKITFSARYHFNPSVHRPDITIDQPLALAADHTLILATAWYRLFHETYRDDRHQALVQGYFSPLIISRFLQL